MKMLSFSSRAQLLLAALVLNTARDHFCKAQGLQLMCAGEPYDPALTMCCGQSGGGFEMVPIELPPESLAFAECCGDVVVDNRTTGCCMSEPFLLAEAICCGNELHPVDPAVTACCGDVLYEKGPMAGCCAGRAVYDLTEEICCAGQVLGVPAQTHTCCGARALPTSGIERCCGPRTVYDSTSYVCCVHEVVAGLACPTTPPPTTTTMPATTTQPPTTTSTTAPPTTRPTPVDLSPLAEKPTIPWGATFPPALVVESRPAV